MNHRKAPKLLDLSSDQIALPDNGILLLSVDNIAKLMREAHIPFYEDSQQELNQLLKENPQCIQFVAYIEKLCAIEANNGSGVGLSDAEKSHYNLLLDEMAMYRTEASDSTSKMQFKINEIRVRQSQIAKYANVIKLNQTYLDVLSKPELWTPECSKVKIEWDVYKRFAKHDSYELLDLYKTYTRALLTVKYFSELIHEVNDKISLKSKSALLVYLSYLSRQIDELQSQAIMSMLFRMQLTEVYHDIYFDDLIYHAVAQVETILQHRIIVEQKNKQMIFDQLKRRQRRGLTFEIIREFVTIIKTYLNENLKNQKNSIKYTTISSQLNQLSFMTIKHEKDAIFAEEIGNDPIIFYLINNFADIVKFVKDYFIIETEKAFSIIASLDALISDAVKHIAGTGFEIWFFKDKRLEEKLESCRKEYLDLLQYVYYFLIDQVNVAGDSLIKSALENDLASMPGYQNSKEWLKKFTERYNLFLLKSIDLKRQDLLIKVVFAINQDQSIISSAENRRYLATMLAQNYYWPIDKEKSREYESTLKYLEYRLECVSKYFGKATFFINAYSNNNWILYYLEQAFPNDDKDKFIRHKVLSKLCHSSWENVFELNEIKIDNQEVMIVPQIVSAEMSDLKSKDSRSTRQKFLSDNASLLKNLNDSASHFKNVVLPYMAVSPFISLFNINNSDRYFEDFNRLSSLYDQLIDNINAEAPGWTATYKSKIFLTQLKRHCEESKKQMILDWSRVLFENINTATRVKDICTYLHDPIKLINQRKLDGIIDKIKILFGNQLYQQTLFGKLQDACADILILNVVEELSRLEALPHLQDFIYCITQLAQAGDFGRGVLDRIIKDREVERLIEGHLKHFDGTRDEIGGLIVALYPAGMLTDHEFMKQYVMPYANKRLEYIQKQEGQCIHYGDIIFFEKFYSVKIFSELFDQYKLVVQKEVIDRILLSHKWDENTAKLIELFGDYQSRCLYRTKCILPLLGKDHPTKADYVAFNQFEASLLHRGENLIDPKLILPEEGMTFEMYVDHYINAPVWSELRDRVIGLLDYQQNQRSHMWFLYQFLNNHAPDFGPWMEAQLEYLTPEEIFGEEGVEYISQHVIGLIKVAHAASHEINMDESQFEMISSLMPNLKYMRMFFKKLGNHVAYIILDDIEMLENNLRLTSLSRKLLRLLNIHEGTTSYDDKSVYNILTQLTELLNEIEKSALINFDNIKAYLCFIDNVVTRLACADFQTMSEMYLVGYFNFCLIVIEHFKKAIMQFVKQSYIPDPDAKFIASLVDCIDDNEKIDQRRNLVAVAFEYNSSLRDVVDYFLDISYRVNLITNSAADTFLLNLMKQGHVQHIDDDPLSFSLACVRNILTHSKVLRLSPNFLSFMIKKIQEALECLPLHKMGDFARHFSPHIIELKQIASNAMQANSKFVTRQTIFQPNQQLVDQPITGALLDVYQQKNICFESCINLIGYIDSKSSIKAVKQYSFIKEISMNMSTCELPQNQKLEYVVTKLGLKSIQDARKILFALELFNTVEMVYLGKLGKPDLLEKVIEIANIIGNKERSNEFQYYQAHDFKAVLKIIAALVRACDSTVLYSPKEGKQAKSMLTL